MSRIIENIKKEADARRDLTTNIYFQDLGKPIQDLLLQISKDVSDADLQLLSKIGVKQLAKIFDMLGQGEDPEKILLWLKRRAAIAATGEDPYKAERKQKIKTGASRNAVEFFHQIEQMNKERAAEMEKRAEEREKERLANLEKRKRKLAEAQAAAAAAAEEAKKNGENTTAVDRMAKGDVNAVVNAFDRFSKESAYNNENANQDGEWWKKDEYRRDWEKNKEKGKLWNVVLEGGSQLAPESELAVREDWYQSLCWWKADKFKKDWIATRDVAWWKEEPYIKDWQDNKGNGKMWIASDELLGFNKKGDSCPAPSQELAAREEWYQRNGPKGVEKKWNALFPDAKDRCTLEEKKEREAYYKSGDWWKSDEAVRAHEKFNGDLNLKVAAKEVAENREWWMSDEYRKDFEAKGPNGAKWLAATEEAGYKGEAQAKKCSEPERARREQWYKDNWWKAAPFAEDFFKNGPKSATWRAKSTEEAGSASPKTIKDSQAKEREAFFLAQEDLDWWKDEDFRRDFEDNGPAGKKWTAAFSSAGRANEGDVKRAPEAELKKREKFFHDNWWKAERFVKDFQKNGTLSDAWKCGAPAEAKRDTEWWKQDAFIKEHKKAAEDNKKAAGDSQWWQDPKYIEDFQKNGPAGTKWLASDELSGSAGAGAAKPADAAEQEKRKQWFEDNWWKAPSVRDDWAANGARGEKWRAADKASVDAGAGGINLAPEAELKKRLDYFARNPEPWAAIVENAATPQEAAKFVAPPAEIVAREKWYEDNWWKTPEMKEAFNKGGDAWKAASEPVAVAGKAAEYSASPDEVRRRQEWFSKNADNEWWQAPPFIDNWINQKGDGGMWTASDATSGRQNTGKSNPASPQEKARREQWFNDNWWKQPKFRKDFEQNGDKGPAWTAANADAGAAGQGQANKATPAELDKRKQWFQANKEANPEELARRKEWFDKQLSDDEVKMRKQWYDNRDDEEKKIDKSELEDLLTQLNEGMRPTPQQIEEFKNKIAEHREAKRKAEAFNTANKAQMQEESLPRDDGISQDEFLHAVAATGMYVAPDANERKMQEEEIVDKMQQEEFAREEEEAGFLAIEAQNEAQDGDMILEDDEEGADKAYEEAVENRVNEDDMVNEHEEKAWEEFQKMQTEDKPRDVDEDADWERQQEEDDKQRAELQKREQEAWEKAMSDPTPSGDHHDSDHEDHPANDTLVAAQDANLDKDVKEDEDDMYEDEDDDGEWEEEEEEPTPAAAAAAAAPTPKPANKPAAKAAPPAKPKTPEEQEIERMMHEDKGNPAAWKIPLPKVTNPQYLKPYFTVLKYNPGSTLFAGTQKRVWVVDHFVRCFYNMDTDGKIKKEHAANKLLQLEKNIMDPKRIRMMFFDANHSYELCFNTCEEREHFYESASAIRPSIRVYCPDLTKPDTNVESCTTTIDGVGPNTIVVKVPTKKGESIERELTGECKINTSKLATEPLTIWVGTFNLAGGPPPKREQLDKWIPKNQYDMYAVATQETSYQKQENEWFNYVQSHLGKDYLTLASMHLWDITLIVLTRKKNLLKITNVEGSTKATVHKNVCGTKGGVGISLRFHETSLCFVSCQLAGKDNRSEMRNTNIEEIVNQLQLANKDVDLCNQFHHVFWMGDMNYRVELDQATGDKHIKAHDYDALLDHDQLALERQRNDILHGFREAPIMFPPTYRFTPNSNNYNADAGKSASYTDRVLWKSMQNTWLKCTGYNHVPEVATSEHKPVFATYIIRAVRPCLSSFFKNQTPRPEITITSLAVTSNKGPVIKKAQACFYSPFSAAELKSDKIKGDTATPHFEGSQLPKIGFTNHVPDMLETTFLSIIIRDLNEKREDKQIAGSAVLTLDGKIKDKQGRPQAFKLDMTQAGKLVGAIEGTFVWNPATEGI